MAHQLLYSKDLKSVEGMVGRLWSRTKRWLSTNLAANKSVTNRKSEDEIKTF